MGIGKDVKKVGGWMMWLPGLLLGIDLLMSGCTILFTGGAVRVFGKDVLKESASRRER